MLLYKEWTRVKPAMFVKTGPCGTKYIADKVAEISTSCKRNWVVYKMLDLHMVREQIRWPCYSELNIERRNIERSWTWKISPFVCEQLMSEEVMAISVTGYKIGWSPFPGFEKIAWLKPMLLMSFLSKTQFQVVFKHGVSPSLEPQSVSGQGLGEAPWGRLDHTRKQVSICYLQHPLTVIVVHTDTCISIWNTLHQTKPQINS